MWGDRPVYSLRGFFQKNENKVTEVVFYNFLLTYTHKNPQTHDIVAE